MVFVEVMSVGWTYDPWFMCGCKRCCTAKEGFRRVLPGCCVVLH